MIRRCNNPNCSSFKFYGARGIKVCQQWLDSFSTFLSDVGRRPDSSYSIERKKYNEDYKPGNVIWATDKEQANNKRSNVKLRFGNCEFTIAQWAEKLGFSKKIIDNRLRYGWSIAECLLTPSRGNTNPVWELNGVSKTRSMWAAELGIHPRCLQHRLNRGWTLSEVLTVSIGTRLKRKT